MREYNIGVTLKNLFYVCEWWEILALLYASYEDHVHRNNAHKEAQEEAKIEQKYKEGKLRGIYRPKMSNALKQKLMGKR